MFDTTQYRIERTVLCGGQKVQLVCNTQAYGEWWIAINDNLQYHGSESAMRDKFRSYGG